MMPDIVVAADKRAALITAHEKWSHDLARNSGQLNEPIPAMSPADELDSTGRIRFVNVQKSFLDYLLEKGFPFEEI
jgi:hypothetical protein